MFDGRGATSGDPYALPGDPATRRMAITTLAYRALAARREVQLNDALGPDADLLST